jgi:hypothetical protein
MPLLLAYPQDHGRNQRPWGHVLQLVSCRVSRLGKFRDLVSASSLLLLREIPHFRLNAIGASSCRAVGAGDWWSWLSAVTGVLLRPHEIGCLKPDHALLAQLQWVHSVVPLREKGLE